MPVDAYQIHDIAGGAQPSEVAEPHGAYTAHGDDAIDQAIDEPIDEAIHDSEYRHGEYPYGDEVGLADADHEHLDVTSVFGHDDHDSHHGEFAHPVNGHEEHRRSRSEARRLQRASKQRRRGRLVVTLGLVLILAVAGAGWFVVRPALTNALGASDYKGNGTGSVLVQIHPGDGAAAIASTLHSQGVIKSDRSFVMAAAANQDAKSIQPGYYRLNMKMQASAALTMLLDPKSKVSNTLTFPEGSTVKQMVAKLVGPLKLTQADFDAVTSNPSSLGLPAAYAPADGKLTSLEGLLFPDTYTFDPGTSASDAISTMVNEFISTDRSTHFSDQAKAVGLTPYQALIVASMVEGEAKFDADRPKVARVILNRLAANRPLQIDATSVYGAILAGRDPKTLSYNEADPYNTRNTIGLPPTPIDNPGAASLQAAVNPAAGDWTHYVNGDADGHLVFTDEAGFEAARLACVQNHWGCD
ncbi:endolytic transglycosylase MltG [Jatrophihabitans sp. GAS493]|uniref:endolytic transglycosylase MltG n=1 Tax=Jatrophihabitans sp. GAS493 TaxID=1907575 RepID=UPI0012FDD2F1|nr:endolytic transglycosylase MltG [Jatrophihabitans sp. GAS493]